MSTAKGVIPYDWREYFQEKLVDKIKFQTKLTIAIKIIDSAIKQKLVSLVLADSWYGVKPFFKALRKRSLQFICAHKMDGTKISICHKRINVKDFVKNLTDEMFNTRHLRRGRRTIKIRYHSKIIHYQSIGKIKIIVSQYWCQRNKKWKKPKVLVCNVLYWSALKILDLYRQRWSIEVFHREAKQSFGLGDYQVRTRKARHVHVQLVFLASIFRHLTSLRLFGKGKTVRSTDCSSDAPLKKKGLEDSLWQALAAQRKGSLQEFLEVNRFNVERFKVFV